MSDKIKFIVDDLADYTGILNNYSDYIYYLPKKIKVGDEVMYTTQTYDDSLYEKLYNFGALPQIISVEEYKEYFEAFLNDFDGQLIYLKPYTYGLFDGDLSNLSTAVSELNEDRIHIFETDCFNCSLHFILLNLIIKYVNENTSVFELEEFCSELNSSVYEYISFYDGEILSATNWSKNPRNFVLFKLQNREKEEVNLEQVDDSMLFYKLVADTVSEDINNKDTDCILTMSTHRVNNEKMANKDYFLSFLKDTKDIQTEFYSKSQSNFAINNDGDSISIH